MTNLITLFDSYKYSQFMQYPEGTEYIHSYLESRGGEYEDVVMSGLQYYLQEYLSKPITQADIDEAAELAELHGEPFLKEGWEYILLRHNGYLPVVIKALPEGSIITPKNVMLTIENTDPNCAWLTSPLETLLLKIWYPTTVASKSHHVRKLITKYHERTMDDASGVDFSYHNFGDRGSSSVETAALGGMAHLTQFLGTDNFNSLLLTRKHYQEHIAGFSIPASEHSTVTSWERENEFKMIESYLEKSKGRPIIACVMDSYNVFEAVDFVTSVLKEKIESDEYPKFVIRPDSGDPVDVVGKLLAIMEKNGVAYTVNSKGFKVFNKFSIIWGDGITPRTIEVILNLVESLGYGAGVIAFGSGGDLMQNVNRDTSKFAFKCSLAVVNGVDRDVFKDPITDQGKMSKKGRLTLVKWKKAGWSDRKITNVQTIRQEHFDPDLHEELLVEVFRDGKVNKTFTFVEVRENSRKGNLENQ